MEAALAWSKLTLSIHADNAEKAEGWDAIRLSVPKKLLHPRICAYVEQAGFVWDVRVNKWIIKSDADILQDEQMPRPSDDVLVPRPAVSEDEGSGEDIKGLVDEDATDDVFDGHVTIEYESSTSD